VWIGNDSGEEMNKVTGGGLPAQIWHDVMLAAHAGHTPHDLPGLAPVVAAVDAGPASNADGLGALLGHVVGN
jgi:penicillin-binding protein 1A